MGEARGERREGETKRERLTFSRRTCTLNV